MITRYCGLPLVVVIAVTIGVWANWIANDGRGLFSRREKPRDFAKLRAKLNEPVSVTVQCLPLREALDQLAARHAINIRIDESALEELEFSGNEPISLVAREIRLGSAIQCCLRMADPELAMAIQDEAIIVTQDLDALGIPEYFEGRVYPVTTSLTAPGPVSAQILADVIRRTIRPTWWEGAGGSGVIKTLPGAVAVAHTLEVHAEIESLMRQLDRLGRPDADLKPLHVLPLTSPGTDRVWAALNQPVRFEFFDKRLDHVCAELSDRVGVPIVLDQYVINSEIMADFVIAPSGQPVFRPGIAEWETTVVTAELPLRAALAQALDFSDLTLRPVVRDGIIWITTDGKPADTSVVRLYPVWDLMEQRWVPGHDPYEEIRDLIHEVVDPWIWKPYGDETLCGVAGALVVNQSPDVHRKVDQLLAGLRQLLDPTSENSHVMAPAVDRRIEQALQEKSSIRADQTPLIDVVDHLRQRHEIDISLDRLALIEVGSSQDALVTCQANDLPLEILLGRLLRPLDMSFVIQGSALRITSTEFAQRNATLWLHDVRHLIDPDLGILSPDDLMDVITDSISPTQWSVAGGDGQVHLMRGILIVSQAREIHWQVTALLDTLTHYQQSQSSPEILLVSSPSQARDLPLYLGLRQEVDFDLRGIPLSIAAAALSDQLDLPIEVDFAVLEEHGVSPDALVTFTARGIGCGAALEALVNPLGLACIVRDEKILITHADMAEATLISRIYPVGDLLYYPDDVPELPSEAGAYPGLPDWDRPSRFGPPSPDYDSLTELIEKMIDNPLWLNTGGPGTASHCAGALVVEQTWQAHFQLEHLLAQLRQALWPQRHVDSGLARVAPAREEAVVRVYDVRRLISRRERSWGRRRFVSTPLNYTTGVRATFVHEEPGKSVFTDLVMDLVSPQTWIDAGSTGEIEVYHGLLVVNQSREIQHQLQQLLDCLHDATRQLPPIERVEAGIGPEDADALVRTIWGADDERLVAYGLYLFEQAEIPAEKALPGLTRRLARLDPVDNACLYDRICQTIARYGSQAKVTVPLLVKSLTRVEDAERRIVIIKTLGRTGPSAGAALCAHLARRVEDDSLGDRERWALLSALSNCGEAAAAATEPLLKLLAKSPDHHRVGIERLLTEIDPEGDRCRQIVSRWKHSENEKLNRLAEDAAERVRTLYGDPT